MRISASRILVSFSLLNFCSVSGAAAALPSASATVSPAATAPSAAIAQPAQKAPMDASASAARSGPKNEKSSNDAKVTEETIFLARLKAIQSQLEKQLGRAVPVGLDPSDDVNAWTDGRSITVTRGMLRFVTTDDELAAVLAHESGHIRANHPTKEATAQVLAILASIFAGRVGGGEAAGGTYFATQLALRKYSRDEESEADRLGLKMMEDAGYDGRGMAQMLGGLSRTEIRNPALLAPMIADHPAPGARVRRLTTYRDLNPNLPDFAKKLEAGLQERGSSEEARLLAFQLAHPAGKDVPAESHSDAPPAGLIDAAPAADYDPAYRLPELDGVRALGDTLGRAGSNLIDVVETLSATGRRTVTDGTWFSLQNSMIEHAWSAASALSKTIAPTAATLLEAERAQAMMTAARSYPLPAEAKTPAEAAVLARVLRQKELAAPELDAAMDDTRDAAAACSREARSIASGVAYLRDSFKDDGKSRSGFLSPQLSIGWFASGEVGVARQTARSALRGAASAELRLQVAALDWQSLNLSPGAVQDFVGWARRYLGLPAGAGPANSRTSGPVPLPGQLGSNLVRSLVDELNIGLPEPAPLPVPDGLGAEPAISNVTSMDPVSLAKQRRQDLDVLEIAFRPVFVHIERELRASRELATAADLQSH